VSVLNVVVTITTISKTIKRPRGVGWLTGASPAGFAACFRGYLFDGGYRSVRRNGGSPLSRPSGARPDAEATEMIRPLLFHERIVKELDQVPDRLLSHRVVASDRCTDFAAALHHILDEG
jgi:hypothetical protein